MKCWPGWMFQPWDANKGANFDSDRTVLSFVKRMSWRAKGILNARARTHFMADCSRGVSSSLDRTLLRFARKCAYRNDVPVANFLWCTLTRGFALLRFGSPLATIWPPPRDAPMLENKWPNRMIAIPNSHCSTIPPEQIILLSPAR